MKFYGDIPPGHLELIRELETLEEWFKEHGNTVPPTYAAKGFVCIAHDYYQMDMEEVGERFLKDAEKLDPGYFRGPIHKHRAKDEDFDLLVTQLTKTMALDFMYSLGFGE